MNNARNLKLSISQKYLELHCPISFCCELRLWEFITDSSIFPLQLSEAESEFLRLLDLPPGVFIPAGDASSMKELHLAIIYPDFQRSLKIEVHVPFVGKYFLAL